MRPLTAVKCDLIERAFVVCGEIWWYKMPSDIVTFAVSTGLGVSVVAGIVSGICYVLAHGIKKQSNRKTNREWYCDVCGAYLRSIDGILEGDKVVTCAKCQGRVCKHRCSSLTIQQKGWTCKSCLRPPESWFQGILRAIQPTSKVDSSTTMNSDSLNEIDEDLEAIRKKEKEQVREFIERLVGVLLGENVDDASVTKLYNNQQYDSLFTRYHQDLSNALTELGSSLHMSIANLPISGQSPCTAHAALKQLIERLLRETVTLPSLQKAQEIPAVSSDASNRTYEDLLATAIINKVISSCQNNLPSSSAASVSSRISSSSRRREEKEYFFGEETLDSKWKTTDLDTSSVSSLEEWLPSDSSLGSRKYVDKVTLTIKQDIEELSQTDSENENDQDDFDYFRSNSSLLNDEEQNWFLQKRQFQGTHSPVPVPMLVPHPTTEAKVLIGDKEVDDTSDLSDIPSDYEDVEQVPGRQSLLIESKTLIGGKNPLKNGDSEGESSADSGVKEVERNDGSGYDGPIYVSKTDITVDDDNVEDASILSIYSNTEKEAEYTEKYASLPRTIMKTPTPPSRPSLQKIKYTDSNGTNVEDIEESEERNDRQECVEDDEEQRKVKEFTGSYSKKEKEKWKYAIEMKNNPYSKENIEKRIKRSNSAVSSLFGPDYYARQASSPSGGKTKSNEAKGLVWPPPKTPEDDDIHKAVPVIISQEDEEPYVKVPESDRITPEIKPRVSPIDDLPELTVSEVTSDSDLSYVNCYDVENSQVYKKTKEGFEVAKSEPEVRLIDAKPIPEETKEKSDENANLSSERNNHREEEIEVVTREVPIIRERKIIARSKIEDKPNFVKAQPLIRQRTLPQPSNTRTLKRFKSETDLLEDSFDAPPTVISRKKDNTLISKIYLDPNVRNFALSSRHHLPVEDVEAKPAFRNQLSVDAKVFATATEDTKKTNYNSDDATAKIFVTTTENTKNYSSDDNSSLRNGKKPFYSSEEDLIDIDQPSEEENKITFIKNEKAPTPKSYTSVRNYKLKGARQSISSEDGQHSDHSSVTLEKPSLSKNTRNLIYSSSEDLLSIEDNERVPKKKDNTLISKIYQDPNVRSFGLSKRDYIPVPEESYSARSSRKSHYSSEEDLLSNSPLPPITPATPLTPFVKVPQSNGFSFPSYISMESLKIEDVTPATSPSVTERVPHEPVRKITSPDSDIDELAKKKIVHNMLGQYSKSQTNLVEVHKRKISEERTSLDTNEITVSVKDLKKRFESNDVKSKVVSSLTARSLSKHMRETLKN